MCNLFQNANNHVSDKITDEDKVIIILIVYLLQKTYVVYKSSLHVISVITYIFTLITSNEVRQSKTNIL